ncbi:hypothetical protein ACFLU6_16225 [Acidobacteriota bacterium]
MINKMQKSVLLWMILSLMAGVTALGEVSVQTDSSSEFLSLNTTIKSTNNRVEYWSRTTTLPEIQVLNSGGDGKGDGAPLCTVTSRNVGQPTSPNNDMVYVVWTRHDGEDLELVYAYFSSNRWSPVQLISSLNNTYNDRDPSTTHNNGKLYLTWWTDEEIPKVYFSKYDGNNWTVPEVVSDPSVSSMNPQIFINVRNELVITFQAFDGHKTTTTSLIREHVDPYD